jgi:hypothetical protein
LAGYLKRLSICSQPEQLRKDTLSHASSELHLRSNRGEVARSRYANL